MEEKSVGLDQCAFPASKHFTSWFGLCPHNRITGRRVKISKTPKVVNRATNAFRLIAQALAYSLSALGAYYRRMRARLSVPKTITATVHKLSRIFYHLCKNGDFYHDLGADY